MSDDDLAQKLCDALPHKWTLNDYRYAQGKIAGMREAGLIVIDPEDEATIERVAAMYEKDTRAGSDRSTAMRAALRAAGEGS